MYKTYKPNKPQKSTLKVRNVMDGETLETKVNRIVNNKEPIKDGAPLIYTERKEGVKAEMNIRTDRWELALDAMDKVNADKIAKRTERQQAKDTLKGDPELKAIQKNDGEAKSAPKE